MSEAQYKAMKVTELKDLLTKAGLQTTGKKEELISRLLSKDAGGAADEEDPLLAAPADFDWNTESTAEHAATDAPALASFNNATPAAVAETVKSDAPTQAATTGPPVPTVPAFAAPSTPASVASASSSDHAPAPTDEKVKTTEVEIARQKARAARFGIPYVEKASIAPPRPRLPSVSTTAKTAITPKASSSASSTASTTPAPSAAVAVEPKKVVDPAKLAEEEEKKRKRLEKFGPVQPPVEKKAKV